MESFLGFSRRYRRRLAARRRRAREAAAARARAEAAERARIAEERAREEARLRLCKRIKERMIPELEQLIVKSKKKLSDLKNQLNNCEKEYSNDCKIDVITQDLNNNQILYANLKTTLSNLTSAYNLEKCDITETCDIPENKNKLAISQYEISNKILNYKKDEYNKCIDPYRNDCAHILKDLEKSKEHIEKDMTILKNMETFGNINDNRELNTMLLDMRYDNNLLEKELREYKQQINNHTDNYLQYDEEVYKNILLTTAGSVMLYYLFFEL